MATLFRGVELCRLVPYCHDFLPALQTLYEEVNADGKPKRLEIVFVSSDTGNDVFTSYFKAHHGAWYAIPHGNADLRAEIKRKYQVAGRKELAGLGLVDRKGGLPTLLVVDTEGNAIDYGGVDKVNKLGPVALEKWEKELAARS